MFATQKHARNETCVEVYSRCSGHFTKQISRVSCFEPFRTGSGKITKSKEFYYEKIFNEKIVQTGKRVWVILVQRNFFSQDSHETCS